ncbi:MAG TPA: hypothetical protein VN915_03495 [Elusimicrobiota bacterium]|nr:hypothetical protein [Elusimicrobiota bacterium]
MPATGAKKRISIDFPTHRERITASRYTFRLTAALGPGDRVMVSVDDSPFESCRFDGGHWWFDWVGYRSHHHRLVAKIVSPDGQLVSEAARRFVVALGDELPPGTLDYASPARGEA